MNRADGPAEGDSTGHAGTSDGEAAAQVAARRAELFFANSFNGGDGINDELIAGWCEDIRAQQRDLPLPERSEGVPDHLPLHLDNLVNMVEQRPDEASVSDHLRK